MTKITASPQRFSYLRRARCKRMPCPGLSGAERCGASVRKTATRRNRALPDLCILRDFPGNAWAGKGAGIRQAEQGVFAQGTSRRGEGVRPGLRARESVLRLRERSFRGCSGGKSPFSPGKGASVGAFSNPGRAPVFRGRNQGRRGLHGKRPEETGTGVSSSDGGPEKAARKKEKKTG